MSNMAFELYHIAADPYETTNLAASRTDIRNALQQVVQLEGVLEEPYFQTGVYSPSVGFNVFFTQYKTWSPQGGSTSFAEAANWSGGTQRNRTDDPDAKYWNTGPASNWLATIANTSGGFQNASVAGDVKVLGMEIEGVAGEMQVTVEPGATLEAYNGVRVKEGGVVKLAGGTVRTAKDIEIQSGGSLTGAGLIGGYQQVIAAIPEFAGRGLLEPEVRNAGVIDISEGDSAGLLTIDGDYSQAAAGELHIDLFATGAAGVAYDKLMISGEAVLAGTLVLNLGEGFTPLPGQSFSVLSAGTLVPDGLQLAGPGAAGFIVSYVGSEVVLNFGSPVFASADFDGNGTVDADDLAVWQTHFGANSGGQGDADGDGDADGADFLSWQRQLGTTSAAPPNAAVPEPSGLILHAASAILGLLVRPRRRL